RLLLVLRRISHQADIDAAILRPSGCRLVIGDRLILAQTNQENLVSGHVVLLRQVLNDSVVAAFAQVVVVILAANAIGAAFDGEDVALGVGNVGGELIQSLAGFARQIVFVESEVHRGLGDDAIVVEIGHRVLQRVHTIDGLIREILGLIGLSAGGLGLLVHFGGLGLHGLDALLGTRVNVFNVARILRGQVIELVDLVNDRGGFIANVILARAAYGGQGRGQGKCEYGAVHSMSAPSTGSSG